MLITSVKSKIASPSKSVSHASIYCVSLITSGLTVTTTSRVVAVTQPVVVSTILTYTNSLGVLVFMYGEGIGLSPVLTSNGL